ncbi:MAG: hypothetical protein U0V74_01735 [Chitinophagales bacterium]
MKRPLALYLLTAVLLFQAIGAVYGGFSLVLAPDGSLMKIPLSWLAKSPFTNYLIPGVILALVLGLFPLVIIVALWLKPKWNFNALNVYAERYWALTFSLYLGIMLVCWINVQLLMVQQYFWLQPVMALTGILIIVLSLLPSLINYYKR